MPNSFEKTPYTKEEFLQAWATYTFLDEVLDTLGLNNTPYQQRKIQTLADQLNLPSKTKWNASYSIQDFIKAWETSSSIQEVVAELNLSSNRDLKMKAKVLGLDALPEKAPKVIMDAASVKNAWERSNNLAEVAQELGLPDNAATLKKLSVMQKKLGLAPKELVVYATTQGSQTNDLLAAWIDWYKSIYQVAPLDQHVNKLSRTVRELIKAGYNDNSIKWGLAQWTFELHKAGITPPISVVQQKALKHHLAEDTQARTNVELASQYHDQSTGLIEDTPNNEQLEERRW